jgi:hypothetical protein
MLLTMHRRFLIGLGCSSLIACGSATTTPSSESDRDAGSASMADGSTQDAAGSDAGLTTPDGAPCPTSDVELKACQTDSDCVAALVPACCGSGRVIGIARATAVTWRACNPVPSCGNLGCASSSFIVPDEGAQVECPSLALADCVNVACVQGQCTSEAPPSDAGGQ